MAASSLKAEYSSSADSHHVYESPSVSIAGGDFQFSGWSSSIGLSLSYSRRNTGTRTGASGRASRRKRQPTTHRVTFIISSASAT